MVSCAILETDLYLQQTLLAWAGQVPYIRVNAVYDSGLALAADWQHNPQEALILDTWVPDISLYELLGTLAPRPLLLFTSAAPLFAVEAYNLGAVDFLAKPYTYQRVLQSLSRLNEQAELRRQRDAYIRPAILPARPYLFVQSEYKLVRVDLDSIMYIEGLKDYVKICPAQGKSILTITRMKLIEDRLPAGFVRVHRSYIVQLCKVDAVQRNRLYIGDKEIPIGDMYSARFYELLEG